MTCRYHAAPLVCGEPGCFAFRWEHQDQQHGLMLVIPHDFRPAHRITVCGVCGEPGSPVGWDMERSVIVLLHLDPPDDEHPYQPVERDMPCEDDP